MGKKVKAFIMVLVISVMMILSSLPSFAIMPEEDGIMPLWESVYEVEVYVEFNGTTCMPGGIASKQSTATSIEGTLTVYEEVDGQWEELYSWYRRVTRGSLVLGEDFEATSGVRYKAVFEVTAYTGTTPETVVFEDIGTCP